MTKTEGEYLLMSLKTMLGSDDNKKDKLLSEIIESTVDWVMAYCKLDMLPSQLYGTVVQMCLEMYKRLSKKNPEIIQINQGERKIRFSAMTEDVYLSFQTRLKPFINRKGRLPSEVR